MSKETVIIEFEVKVMKTQYAWKERGEAKAELSIPKEYLTLLDPGNILMGLLQSAVTDFDVKQEEAEENEDV